MGLAVTGKNYYDLLPETYHQSMSVFHSILQDTPCGAYIVDAIETTSGNRYVHETLQLPISDEFGEVRYLLVYGLDRKPYGDRGSRTDESHQPSNIKEMHYIDLGAGAPTVCVENFNFRR